MTLRRRASPRALVALALLPLLALTAGEALAQPADFDPAKELLRIAKMKQNDRLLASFAEARGRTAPNLTEKELFVIVDTVERTGTPDHAISMLQGRVKRFPRDLDARVALAKMYVRASQTPNAVAIWKDLAAKLGLTPALAIEYAHVLSITGDHASSLSVLASVMKKAPDDAHEYWSELAQAAWDQDDSATALIAYKKVWTAEPPLPSASSRLMQLLADAGQHDEAIVVAKQALLREKNPAHLLFVARLQIKSGDYGAAKATLDLADDHRALVASTLEYWMLRAEVLSRIGDKDGARAAHRVALRLDPNAPGVRAALLWDAIDRNDLRTLAVDLKQWAPEAARDREMWGPMAVGLDRIGRTRDAIRFFVLQTKEAPTDHLWALEFADALARVGEEDVSTRIRRRAFTGIRALAAAALKRVVRAPAPDLPTTPVKPDAKALGPHRTPAGASKATPAPRAATPRAPGRTRNGKPHARSAPAADEAPEPTPAPTLTPAESEKLLETHAGLTQQFRGEPEAERWVRRMLDVKQPTVTLEEFAVGWYLQEDNVDTARRHLAKARLLRLERSSARRYALLIAMADDDRVAIEHLLATPNDLSDGEKASAYIRLERDDRAVQPLMAMIDRADLAAPGRGAASVLPADSDAPTLRRELRSIEERTAPTLRGGGHFAYLNDLAVTGPLAGGSFVTGATRIIYGAGGRQFNDFGTSAVAVDGRLEADAQVVVRRIGARHAQEGRLGIDYQAQTPNGLPMPRAGYTGVFQHSKKLSTSIDVTANGRIEDTSFLRVAGLRDAVNFDIAFEPVGRVFIIGSVVTLEDHTRSFDYLGVEAGGGIEAGFKILERVPEWSIGARIGAYGRDNRSDIPDEYRAIVKPNETRASVYPPSYQQAMLVMRIARGDFFERARQELVAFPRYDCEINGGFLTGIGIKGARPAGAAALRCALSVRVPTNGYVSVTGEYIKGVTGLAQADNAHLGLTFTQFLR